MVLSEHEREVVNGAEAGHGTDSRHLWKFLGDLGQKEAARCEDGRKRRCVADGEWAVVDVLGHVNAKDGG